MLLFFAALPARTQAPITYNGKLDGRLHIDPRSPKIRAWDQVTANDGTKLGISVKSGDRIFKGTFELTDDFPELADSPFGYMAAVVQSADGTDALYADLNRDGRFEENERFQFQPVYIGYPGYKAMKSHVGLELPLTSGPYRSSPIEVALFKPGAQVFWPVASNQMPLMYSADYFVEGSAQLPDRLLLMRFAYDFKQNAIDLEHGAEWADVNGDGKIDLTTGSPEILTFRNHSFLFRVGKLVLSTKTVDPATNTFVLRSVPPAEYSGIDLLVGSTLPDFAYTDLGGMTHHLSEIKAKVLLLDFWATWCHGCVADLPSKLEFYQKFHDRGFEILGMNGDRAAMLAPENPYKSPQELLDKMHIAWPEARFDHELFDNKLHINNWPTLVLIDADRKILSTGQDELPLHGESLGKTLETLLPVR